MKIHYITQHGVALWTEISPDDNSALTLSFDIDCDGVVTLRGKRLAVKGGEVKIPTVLLSDGEFRPTLESEAGIFAVEGFIKRGNNITMQKTDESVLRRIIKDCLALKSSEKLILMRVEALEALCQGHGIFNYERKGQ